MTHEKLPVLVVGAGPVGLTAMAELTRRGVRARLVDRAAGASDLTKALLVWPRTLEVLHRLCGVRAVEEHAQVVRSFRYYSDDAQVCEIAFGAATRPVVITQPHVEAALHGALGEGAVAEWSTTLVGLQQDDDVVHATLRGPDGQDRVEAFSYVVACDGAGSTARDELGLEFTGMTYPSVFILADARIDGDLEPGVVHYFCSSRGVLVMVPLKDDRFRVFTVGPAGMTPEDLTLDLLQSYVDDRGPGRLVLRDVSWQTTFNIHARHTETFQVGRVFLAGDAAHVHSPAGGQGLNTGVTDAHNLAWKLALVHHGVASPALLSSYTIERSSVSAAVVKQASMQTAAWMVTKPWQIALRDKAAHLGERLGLFERRYTPWLAGMLNHYPDSLASDSTRSPWRDRHTRLRGGRLVPNLSVRAGAEVAGSSFDHVGVTGRLVRLREVLPIDRYTVLVHGAVTATEWEALRDLSEHHPQLLGLRAITGDGELTIPSGPAPSSVRERRSFSCALVRPDHYVAVCDTSSDLRAIRAHLAAIAVPVPSPAAPASSMTSARREPVLLNP